MITKTITFTNYDDETCETEASFNLNEQDVLEIEAEFPGGIDNVVEEWEKTNDARSMLKLFKLIISKAYGKKSENGMIFVKTPDQSRYFMQSAAYEQFFRELITDQELAVEFFNKLVRIPKDLASDKVKRS